MNVISYSYCWWNDGDDDDDEEDERLNFLAQNGHFTKLLLVMSYSCRIHFMRLNQL